MWREFPLGLGGASAELQLNASPRYPKTILWGTRILSFLSILFLKFSVFITCVPGCCLPIGVLWMNSDSALREGVISQGTWSILTLTRWVTCFPPSERSQHSQGVMLSHWLPPLLPSVSGTATPPSSHPFPSGVLLFLIICFPVHFSLFPLCSSGWLWRKLFFFFLLQLLYYILQYAYLRISTMIPSVIMLVPSVVRLIVSFFRQFSSFEDFSPSQILWNVPTRDSLLSLRSRAQRGGILAVPQTWTSEPYPQLVFTSTRILYVLSSQPLVCFLNPEFFLFSLCKNLTITYLIITFWNYLIEYFTF